MIELIDYIYYRTYQWYRKKNDSNPDLMGRIVISLSLVLNLFFLIYLLCKLFHIDIDSKLVWLKWGFCILFLLLIEILKLRYRKRISIETLSQKWATERSEERRRRGLLMITYVIGSIVIPAILGIIVNN